MTKQADFKRRVREQQGFVLTVLEERKIFVLGDETDLDRIVQDAQAGN